MLITRRYPDGRSEIIKQTPDGGEGLKLLAKLLAESVINKKKSG